MTAVGGDKMLLVYYRHRPGGGPHPVGKVEAVDQQ